MSPRKEIIGGCELYLGDCREILPTLGMVDACVTDPPYGISFASQPTTGQRRSGLKPQSWDDAAVADIESILSRYAVQVVWGGNYYGLEPSRGWLAWFKPDAPPSMGNVEFAWTNLDQNARGITRSIAATNGERVGHPTQKPLAVMMWTLKQVGSPAKVIDPFMGSGTTGVACVKMGLRFVGIEIDPAYFAIACKRIETAIKQPDLFIEPPEPQPQQLSLMEPAE